MEHIYYISVYTMGQLEFCKYPWQSCFTLCVELDEERHVFWQFSYPAWKTESVSALTIIYMYQRWKVIKKGTLIVGLFGVWGLTLIYNPWPIDKMLLPFTPTLRFGSECSTNYTNFEVWLWMLYQLHQLWGLTLNACNQ